MALTPQEFEKLKIQLQNRKFAKSQIPNADGGFDVVGAIKGKTSFPASMGGITTTAPLENIAKTFGNIPSSVAKMAAPVNPLTTDSPINIGANIAGSGSALYEIYKNRGLAGAKDILGGFADTYLKVGESIYGGIDKAYNALLDDPKKAIADVTERIAKIGIEDPMLIPTILYGSGKLKGGKDPISRFASPITRGADTSLLNVAEKTGIPSLARGAVDITEKIAEKTKTSLFGRPKPISNIDDVIKQADEAMKSDFVASQPLAKEAPKTGLTPSQILTATKQATAQPSLMERWAGIRPDIKNRIAGKPNMMKEYFDVSHARNNFDTLPDPLGYGVKKGVNPAIEIMETKLNKTGNAIGEFRQKIGTYEANISNVAKIENTFTNQLSKLNLEIKNGQVRQTPGTVSRVSGKGDIGVLNDLYKELLTVKQNPNLEKLMDLRNIFDRKINFEKTAREVSSSIDPVSRNVRKSIADAGAEIVGKSQAQNLKEYSEFMDAFENLKSYTDRKAGSEFLLKTLLSERGGVPREIIQTIKKHTGIDLMDHATMAQIATDLIGNASQKGLFRQEITKAGLDAAAILQGKSSGAINLMLGVGGKILGKQKFIEKQFLKAAGQPIK